MKKNRTLKLASGLLILCLITTCAISTTLAKYTTGGSAADTARVARWGVEVSLSGTLFADAYKDNFVAYNNATATVMAVAEDQKVVAPGTRNDVGIEFRLNGAPEVDYSVAATVDGTVKEVFLDEGHWGMMVKVLNGSLNQTSDMTGLYISTDGVTFTAAGSDYDPDEADHYYRLMNSVHCADRYYPINWVVGGTSAAQTRLVDILEQIKTDATKTYAAKDNLAQRFTLTWYWHFNVDTVSDLKDTILGNIQAGTMSALPAGQVVVYSETGTTYSSNIDADKYELGVAYGMTFTATQID